MGTFYSLWLWHWIGNTHINKYLILERKSNRKYVRFLLLQPRHYGRRSLAAHRKKITYFISRVIHVYIPEIWICIYYIYMCIDIIICIIYFCRELIIQSRRLNENNILFDISLINDSMLTILSMSIFIMIWHFKVGLPSTNMEKSCCKTWSYKVAYYFFIIYV